MPSILLGLEVLLQSPPSFLKGCRIGLLCNSASVDRNLVHSRLRLKQILGSALKCIYSPQHGLYAEKQDNMVESDHRHDPVADVPVFSLYGHTRIPTHDMLDPIDVLLVDLQDVGTRVYTFIYTMAHCMEAARRYDKKVVILDRPNPVGGVQIEGNLLTPGYRSFVGRYPIPMRHGLTVGELARMFNEQFGIGCDLEVITMQGWRREMLYPDTGLDWIAPSPNLPTFTSALVYPGQVIWEGTNVSEGRGTTQPFELFGAPYLNPAKLLDALDADAIRGAVLRCVEFEPTSNKWQGHICSGFQIHVRDPHLFQPYYTSLSLLSAIMQMHPEDFEWKAPPYEYEYDRRPIDLILGTDEIRKQLQNMISIEKMTASWQTDLQTFDQMRSAYFLYS